MVKDCRLPKEMLKSLTERLCWPLQLSGVDSIVKQKVPKFLASKRADKRSCVRRTCQVSLECSHLTSPPLLEPPPAPCAERHAPLAAGTVFASPPTRAAVDVTAHELQPAVGGGYSQHAPHPPFTALSSPVPAVWQQLAPVVLCSTAPCSVVWTGLQHQACAQAQPGDK